jgi:hypothetical protein
MGLGAPVYVMNQKIKTDRGREARLGNIRAAKVSLSNPFFALFPCFSLSAIFSK